ncbi:MAG: type II toxin-antitoxin system RelE/ParE family toxin [Cytophagia bacterium]|nr:type II toxin-antitoxin system RelE/ParE family toxin [Cytophagia bacterium]NBW34457.1 type II toxin-antitoxin system RelE/ParE family toxin [Cytophagia bacterium]
MIIKVSKRAEKSFRSIKDFIKWRWGELAADMFEQKVIDFLDILETFPQIGTLESAEKNLYGFQLTKQTRVFYRIKSNTIIIIIFFDVRQNPIKKPK